MIRNADDRDPRLDQASGETSDPSPLREEDLMVTRAQSGASPLLIGAAFAVIAVVLFLWLNGRRTEAASAQLGSSAASAAPAQVSADPPTLDLPLTPANTTTSPAGPFSGLPVQAAYLPTAAPPAPSATPTGSGYASPAPVASDLAQRRRAPALVVDLGGPPERVLAQATAGAGGAAAILAAPTGAGVAPAGPRLNDSEQFAARVGDETPERARATVMRNLGQLVPQGSVIAAVLETAINSDLPGFTRAVVSRDVMAFDGSAVLIPRGSRLIGQYKSAVALGQSRAFIIWTRVIRPDGVSVQIGSPATDDLGRGGLAGDVDRHFFRRFSGSILLSVLNAGVAAISDRPSTQISIGSPGAAAGLADAVQGENISPTIKVRQGEAVRIFVSRDLDFSGVGAVR